ncbi:MAG: hypothetical protein NC301_06885 [Bacteroides sp.]|nr:hypothetical protein [Bacteroides sp.]MCM1379923.1 hypothetical protein [Bacteroides sp.]MCM1446222.1 hypothetical protein [Prevotella sp.]
MKNLDITDSTQGWPRNDGRTVPEGYFEDFNRRMLQRLPMEVSAVTEPKRTVWQKIRPYVYMAAMFAGVYLMMNIFTLTTGIRNVAQGQDTSSLLAELVTTGNSNYVDEYVSMSDPYLYDDLYELGIEIPETL